MDIKIETLYEYGLRKHGSFEEFLEYTKNNRGLLSPDEVKDSDYPKKTPIIDDEGITLYDHCGGEYFIHWSRLKDPIDTLLFIHHLCDKCWINRCNIQFLITECGNKFNWGYLGGSES